MEGKGGRERSLGGGGLEKRERVMERGLGGGGLQKTGEQEGAAMANPC